jgi:hypothetical protein
LPENRPSTEVNPPRRDTVLNHLFDWGFLFYASDKRQEAGSHLPLPSAESGIFTPYSPPKKKIETAITRIIK